MSTAKQVKKVHEHRIKIELAEINKVAVYVIETIDLLEGLECKSIAEFEININKKPDGELVKFNYCGDCGQMIQPPVDKDYITIMECYNPITSKN